MCSSLFSGVCVDVKGDDLSNYDLDLSVVPNSSKDLCVNGFSNFDKDDCCKCFKKKGKGEIVFDPRDIFNKKGQKKMRKFLIPKGDVLEIPVTFDNYTIN